MEFFVYTVSFVLILLPLVLGMTVPIYIKHQKTTDGVVNYDSGMKKFLYRVNLPGEEILRRLQTKEAIDELAFAFDAANSIVTISEYASNRKYYYDIQECGDFSIFRLEQTGPIGMRSYVPYKLNPFMVRKLQAELIPFCQSPWHCESTGEYNVGGGS